MLHPGGFPQRALVLIGPDAVVRWSYEADSPGDLPGANLIFDALDRREPELAVAGLTVRAAAAGRPRRPRPRARGTAPLLVVYGDYECPFCAALELRLRELRVRVAFRHFPSAARHPRAFPAACAAEAAAGRARSGRCTTRSSPTRAGSRTRTCGRARSGSGSTSRASTPTGATTPSRARVSADFRGGIRAGVPTTPTLLPRRRRHAGRPDDALDRLANLVA